MKTTCEQKEIKWGIPFLKKINMIRSSAILLFLFVSFNSLFGQKLPPKVFHQGFVVRNEGDTIRGKLKYDFESNLIQLKLLDGRIISLSSQQILNLSFQDDFFNRIRTFYSIPYALSSNIENPIFFEILSEGPITMMTREYLIMQRSNNYNSPFYRSSTAYQIGSDEVLTYDYYFLTKEGEIIEYEKKRKQFLDIFSKHEEEIKKLVKKENLRYDRQGDLVSLTNYYNKLETKTYE